MWKFYSHFYNGVSSSYCCHVTTIQKHLWYLIPRAIYNMADSGGIIHAQRVRQRRFSTCKKRFVHYGDIIMRTMASQITSLSIVCPSVCSGADQRKHQNSTSLAFVGGIHLWPVNSLHKGPVTQKILSFDDVIMIISRDNRWARVFYRMQELRWNMIKTIWQLNARLMWLFLSIYLVVYSLHHNVLPTLQSIPLMTNGPLYPITQDSSCHGQHTMPRNPWSFPTTSSA